MFRIIIVTMLMFVGGAAAADEYSRALADFKSVAGTARFFDKAYGYALFPTIGKAGLVVGGAYGEGHVYKGGAYVGDTTVTQLSIGIQLGGQAYSQIVFFQDKVAFDRFTSGSFEFGAEASAVALTLSAQAKAGTTGASAGGNEATSGSASAKGEWSGGMAVFTLAKGGIMYEASIGGQKFTYAPR